MRHRKRPASLTLNINPNPQFDVRSPSLIPSSAYSESATDGPLSVFPPSGLSPSTNYSDSQGRNAPPQFLSFPYLATGVAVAGVPTLSEGADSPRIVSGSGDSPPVIGAGEHGYMDRKRLKISPREPVVTTTPATTSAASLTGGNVEDGPAGHNLNVNVVTSTNSNLPTGLSGEQRNQTASTIGNDAQTVGGRTGGASSGGVRSVGVRRTGVSSLRGAKTSNFQTTGCLSPTDSPQILANSLKLAAERESAEKEDKSNAIGQYVLLSPLDKSGVSYHALDTKTKQLKTCQVLSVKQRDHLLRITERLNSARFLDWPHGDMEEMRGLVIPSGTELIRHHGDGKLYLFTPKNYGSLHSFVQSRKKLDEATAQKLYSQIARLVAYSHAIGIVVRDLKLRKFVFVDQEQTQLGLGSINDLVVLSEPENDALRDRHGCPAYVSPEILNLQQKSYSGRAADVWSLGVVLFVMLVGRYPFYDSTPAGLFGKIRQGVFFIPSDEKLSLEVRYLLRGLLRREPSERPSALTLSALPWVKGTGRAHQDMSLDMSSRTPATNRAGGRKYPLDRLNADDQLVPSIPLPGETKAKK